MIVDCTKYENCKCCQKIHEYHGCINDVRIIQFYKIKISNLRKQVRALTKLAKLIDRTLEERWESAMKQET